LHQQSTTRSHAQAAQMRGFFVGDTKSIVSIYIIERWPKRAQATSLNASSHQGGELKRPPRVCGKTTAACSTTIWLMGALHRLSSCLLRLMHQWLAQDGGHAWIGDASRRREVAAAGSDPQHRRAALEKGRLRHWGLSAAGKKKLLNELGLLTGYHLKSLLRLLNRRPSPTPDGLDATEEKSKLKPPSPQALWTRGWSSPGALVETSDRLCGKRLAPLLPLNEAALRCH